MTETKTVDVTQADRDAARALHDHLNRIPRGADSSEEIMAASAYALARHRNLSAANPAAIATPETQTAVRPESILEADHAPLSIPLKVRRITLHSPTLDTDEGPAPDAVMAFKAAAQLVRSLDPTSGGEYLAQMIEALSASPNFPPFGTVPTRPRCACCGSVIVADLHADDDLWNAVMRERFGPGYVCVNCFAILATLSPAPDADTVMTEAQARDLLVDAMDNAGAFDPGEVVVSLGDAVKALLAASQVKADPPAPPLPEGAMLLTDFLDEFDKELAALEPDSTGRKPGEPFNPAGAIALGHELDHEDGGYPSPGGGSMTETKRGDAGE